MVVVFIGDSSPNQQSKTLNVKTRGLAIPAHDKASSHLLSELTAEEFVTADTDTQ
jgi:hypothetical protein